MDIIEIAIRDLMDSLVGAYPALQGVDAEQSVDDNVTNTGAPERCVKSYLLGIRALASRNPDAMDPP